MATMKLGSKSGVLRLEGQTWICTTDLVSDIVIEIGEKSFHLHKFPLLNQSGLFQKLISELCSYDGSGCILQLHDIPGGAKAFELVAKFCYNGKIELTALNVVSLRCAAEFLMMSESYFSGNLIKQTEYFLNEVLGNWKDSIKALETCEDVLRHSEELDIVARCIDSLATKACADMNFFAWSMVGHTSLNSPGGTVMWNGICTVDSPILIGAGWWYEDVSSLSAPLYRRVILAMESKGMKPETIAGSLMLYAKRYIPEFNRNTSFQDTNNCTVSGDATSVLSRSDQRVLLEEIVGLLPIKKGVTSIKFLFGLLRTATVLDASPLCRENLEKRIGAQLDEATLEDILIPNLSYSVETLYDIDCVQRIVDHFMSMSQPAAFCPGIMDEGQPLKSSSQIRMTTVPKLVDGYLAEVAPDVNLKFPKFQSLAAVAAAIPGYARSLYDGIYHAMDIYLKSHPWLTNSEREQLCQLMNCQKLSLEASTHAARNERLPLRVVVQTLFFEQLRLRTSISGSFFENMDSCHDPHTNLMPPENDDGVVPTMSHDENETDEVLSADDMRLRVLELEEECLSMKQEIEKLEKPKSSWNILSKKLGFGIKLQQHWILKKRL